MLLLLVKAKRLTHSQAFELCWTASDLMKVEGQGMGTHSSDKKYMLSIALTPNFPSLSSFYKKLWLYNYFFECAITCSIVRLLWYSLYICRYWNEDAEKRNRQEKQPRLWLVICRCVWSRMLISGILIATKVSCSYTEYSGGTLSITYYNANVIVQASHRKKQLQAHYYGDFNSRLL